MGPDVVWRRDLPCGQLFHLFRSKAMLERFEPEISLHHTLEAFATEGAAGPYRQIVSRAFGC